uniref:D-isomer specific 2-hydroxyacid dehydrogenase NAD-binding domain-containing protein n=1 Tax=Ciona savignyi TaxID=51511 RepID=H2ZPN2_CIOSA
MGTGNIGMKIASYLKKLGMTIHGLKNHKMENVENSGLIDEYYYPDNLNGFLASCDYICNILPSTPATTGLLSGNRLEVCAFRKPAFINVGRGDVIDEDSLIHALNAGWISKAFLDVVPIEPLPHSSKLWEMENVVITPHASGPYFTDTLASVFLENLKLYLDEKPLNFQIDFGVEY